MTQLFIRQRSTNKWIDAVLPSSFNFKLTVENTYFTRSGEYSGEITLPLAGCTNNIRLFGFLNRLDTDRRNETFDARLVVNNRTLLLGKLTILECDEKSVKVQLLGSGAATNFYAKSRDLYIDKMNLGTVLDGVAFPPNQNDYYNEVNDLMTLSGYVAVRAAENWSNDVDLDVDTVFGTPDNGFVLLPAQNEDGVVVNQRIFVKWDSDNNPRAIKRLVPNTGYVALYSANNGTFDYSKIQSIFNSRLDDPDTPWDKRAKACPQPYVDTVVHRVISAMGYSITRDDILSGPFAKCYIPSVSQTVSISDMLPHWKVGEFLTEIENFFGVVFVFDDNMKRCEVKSKRDYFGGSVSHLSFIDDAFTTTFEEDQQVDMSSANVTFDMDNCRECVPPEIMEAADNVLCFSWDDVTKALNPRDTYYGRKGAPSRIAQYKGRYYCLWDSEIVEIDQLRDLTTNSGDDSITLKIKPAVMSSSEIVHILVHAISRGSMTTRALSTIFPSEREDYKFTPSSYPTPVCPLFCQDTTLDSVQDAIENGLKKIDKADYLPVALYGETMRNFDLKKDNDSVGHINFYLPWPHTYGADDASDIDLPEADRGLRLVPVEGMTTLYDQAIRVGVSIVGTSVTRMRVYDDVLPPLDRIVRTNGKEYVLQKIEYNISAEGMDRAKFCYFYDVK